MTTLTIIGIVIALIILLGVLSVIFDWGLSDVIVDFFDAIADAISDMDFHDIDWD